MLATALHNGLSQGGVGGAASPIARRAGVKNGVEFVSSTLPHTPFHSAHLTFDNFFWLADILSALRVGGVAVILAAWMI